MGKKNEGVTEKDKEVKFWDLKVHFKLGIALITQYPKVKSVSVSHGAIPLWERLIKGCPQPQHSRQPGC